MIPVIKLVKAWRDAQMTYRRPKSYVLEVMVLYAIEAGELELKIVRINTSSPSF